MDPRQQATFIPKRPVTSLSSERRTMGFFSLVTLIIFLCVGAASGGVYFWRITLQKQLEASTIELAEQEKAFDKAFITAALRLNDRIELSKSLLNKHIAVTNLLSTLSKNTLQSVQFNNFAFNTSQLAGANVVRVTVGGIARDYTSLAAQSIEIAKVGPFKDPIFSDFNLTQEGRVSFGLSMNIDPVSMQYKLKPITKSNSPFDSVSSATTTAKSEDSTNSILP
jgi:hypothetical protein